MIHFPFLQQDIRLALYTLGQDASIDLAHLSKIEMKTMLADLRAKMRETEAKMMGRA